MKKYFIKKLVMTKKDNEVFKDSNKCWVCDNVYVKVRDHCDIIGKYRDFKLILN